MYCKKLNLRNLHMLTKAPRKDADKKKKFNNFNERKKEVT